MRKSIILVTFETISLFFSSIFTFACGFYILKITQSGSVFGSYLAVLAFVTTISAPFIGSLIDRTSNKKILLMGQFISVCTLLMFYIFYNEEVYTIFTAMMILVFVDSIVKITITSNLKFITGDYIEKIVSIRQTIQSSSILLTPIIGGFIVTIININLLALINSLTELIAFFLLLLLTFKSGNSISKEQKFLTSFIEGFKHLSLINNLKVIFIVSLFINFLCNSLIVGLPIIIIKILNLKANYLGVAESTIGGAIVISSVLLSILNIHNRLKLLYIISMILQSLSLLIVASTRFYSISEMNIFIIILIANAFLGFSVSLNNIPFQIILQQTIDEKFKSRVFSIIQSLNASLTPLSYFIFGFLIPLNYAIVYAICALGILILLFYFKLRYNFNENSITE
ncbi:MFS transporter [Staphylococcus schleiferi]|uniref:MFS transporter n=1 Tax=Staphylococcus schleiferi TaxID=1295 RepID=UPI0024813E75|nr:MFS transporter [Staphylococcus schleiferi]